jgi:hypothetical protein
VGEREKMRWQFGGVCGSAHAGDKEACCEGDEGLEIASLRQMVRFRRQSLTEGFASADIP